MIGDMLECRSKNGPRLLFSLMNHSGTIVGVCIKPDGLIEAVPIEALSADWHYDETRGWVRDFEPEESDEG